MPGRTIYDAAEAFLEPIRRSLGVLGVAKLYVSPGGRHEAEKEHVWMVNQDNRFQLSNELAARINTRPLAGSGLGQRGRPLLRSPPWWRWCVSGSHAGQIHRSRTSRRAAST